MLKQTMIFIGLAVLVSLAVRPFQDKQIPFWGFPEPMKMLTPKAAFAADVNASADSAFAPAELAYKVDLAQTSGLYMKRKKNNVHFVDARDPKEYAEGHIPGSINIPAENLAESMAKLDSIPKADLVLIYCDGGECRKSHDLAEYMLPQGWKRLAIYEGGWEEWSAEMDAVETTETH